MVLEKRKSEELCDSLPREGVGRGFIDRSTIIEKRKKTSLLLHNLIAPLPGEGIKKQLYQEQCLLQNFDHEIFVLHLHGRAYVYLHTDEAIKAAVKGVVVGNLAHEFAVEVML